jgi:hypothetical protein
MNAEAHQVLASPKDQQFVETLMNRADERVAAR